MAILKWQAPNETMILQHIWGWMGTQLPWEDIERLVDLWSRMAERKRDVMITKALLIGQESEHDVRVTRGLLLADELWSMQYGENTHDYFFRHQEKLVSAW